MRLGMYVKLIDEPGRGSVVSLPLVDLWGRHVLDHLFSNPENAALQNAAEVARTMKGKQPHEFRAMKRIAAMEGDYVETNETAIFVNGRHVGNRLSETEVLKFAPIKPWICDGRRLEAHEVLLLGDGEPGCDDRVLIDGRYTGPVDRRLIEHTWRFVTSEENDLLTGLI